ncbi:hypothetical protein VC0101557_04880 [Vibrio cholerae VC0101557]|nr:hypothetical protein VCHC49A2_1218 [Vibrio cholerae HC-49A2]EGS55741.1 hypothetical protein VCHC40A1_3076 [Vibrio cholerae HC-40A1]EGS55760.1 hypothetical protein VCHC48A1_3056 [Vibrio cholerae HC-48A1]EHH79911.1 hypothetical protein VCHC06A1_3257 [Vibrio cholerae HC-06A1]EHH89681.1 hypothetical protein VCHC22A1_3776 [Vibrio cholerae HC-22A1]EJH32580.1 hypothetical protein VCCP104114_0952 [Vibrio cholerae CP1041(14)]EJH41349.1 hypothetical protein VCCP104619_1677 [Vibrio cholerae CP1046(19
MTKRTSKPDVSKPKSRKPLPAKKENIIGLEGENKLKAHTVKVIN